jgi:DNA recombination protein RmuC
MSGEDLTYAVAALASLSLLLTACCLFLMLGQRGAVARLMDALARDAQQDISARLEGLGQRAREDGEGLRRQLTELDQGLRKEIATGTRDGFAAAFDKVQDGATRQTEELGRFGQDLRQGIGEVRQKVEDLTQKVAGTLEELRGLLTSKLAEAEVAAEKGRADLLRDVTASVDRARETMDGVLKSFGEEQGRRLEAVATATRDGSEATSKGLLEFRQQVSERMDAVKQETADTLNKAETIFAEIGESLKVAQGQTERTLVEQREAVLLKIGEGQQQASEKLSKNLSDLSDRLKTSLDSLAKTLREEQDRLRSLVGDKLEEMRAGNEAKLEQMRRTVDEQLQSALEKRVGESFQRVAEQFAQVQQAIGQVQSVAGQVGDLKRLFSNVKARGGWGEAQIQSMLDDILTPGSYVCNLSLSDGSSEAVEFAIRMPIKGAEDAVWLPIDSKFPTEDYDRLIQASEAGDREEERTARRALERRIREEARRIAGKYIMPPRTVEFAVMYLPTEGLFAEVSRIPGLVEQVHREFRVMILGPSLLPAMVRCIQIGHVTLALEQKAGVIGETLGAVKAEWEKLGKSLDALAKKADTLANGIRDTQKRTRAVGRTLRTVDAIEFGRAEEVLGLAASGATLLEQEEEEAEPALANFR